MSIEFLSLPEELLDAILGCLLPRLKPHLQLDNIHYQSPVDLLQCRLTCRTLCRIASPWLCRRFDLLETYSSCVNRMEQTRKQFLAKVTFFSTREENAGAVRLLHLDRRHIPEFQDVFSPLLIAQPHFLSRMNNLQILVLKYCKISDICGAYVFAQILQQPKLHTVVLQGVDGMDWSLVKDPLFNLKNMDIGYMFSTGGPLSLAPCLQTLSLKSCHLEDPHESTSLPWGTLKQLRIDFSNGLKAVLDSYEVFLQDTGRLSTPLVELAITPCLDMQLLATTFKSQPLHTLILCDVGHVDIPRFEHIVASFPHLQEFVLLTNEYIEPWAGNMKDYATILARLPQLQSFTWNNMEYSCVYKEDISEMVLQAQLNPFITMLGKLCPLLTRLKLLNLDLEVAVVAHIIRDEKSQYKSHRFKATFDDSRPSTSAWYAQHYESTI